MEKELSHLVHSLNSNSSSGSVQELLALVTPLQAALQPGLTFSITTSFLGPANIKLKLLNLALNINFYIVS